MPEGGTAGASSPQVLHPRPPRPSSSTRRSRGSTSHQPSPRSPEAAGINNSNGSVSSPRAPINTGGYAPPPSLTMDQRQAFRVKNYSDRVHAATAAYKARDEALDAERWRYNALKKRVNAIYLEMQKVSKEAQATVKSTKVWRGGSFPRALAENQERVLTLVPKLSSDKPPMKVNLNAIALESSFVGGATKPASPTLTPRRGFVPTPALESSIHMASSHRTAQSDSPESHHGEPHQREKEEG